jgi:pimeloyl-ACP methyl ester carboxylesterase
VDASSGGRDRYWEWPGFGRVHFETAGTSGAPLLLLPGFGVGSFHFDAQLEALSATHRVFAMDFLGQGESWPDDATGLQFSAELWASQVAAFVENVIGEPAFIAGNSLGVRACARACVRACSDAACMY